jgi:superfamily I DNA/RNA helicase
LDADCAQSILESYQAAETGLPSLAGVLEESEIPSGSCHKLMTLLDKYAPRIRLEKPSALIEAWISDNALSELASMDLLLHTAILHDTMAAFLQNLLLGREGDVVRSGAKRYNPDAVSLMTLHGAKGLEFPIVFLCGVTDGMIPYRNHRKNCNIDEERRLFYVGMTRAQAELVLLTSAKRSPFLSGLCEEYLSIENAFTRGPAPAFEQFSLFD